MVQYRYGQSNLGVVIDAEELAKRGVNDNEEFTCIACDGRLVAKVRGTKVCPHFAHFPGTTCSNPETYLHRLGKRVFAEVFKDCVANNLPFNIQLNHPVVCRRFEEYLGYPCDMKRVKQKVYDLTDFYDEVLLEQRNGSFIPDLLLFKREKPQCRVYVEIAVTHFLSEEKEKSSERIIEIPINSEVDLEKIRSRTLTEESVRFVNFATEDQAVTDSECMCVNYMAQAFIVYKSGKCNLEMSPLCAIAARRMKLQDNIQYFRVVGIQIPDCFPLSSNSIVFQDSVRQARADGFPLRNCYLCRYHGHSYRGDVGRPIFCKYLKKCCNSNEAVECSAFRVLE